MYKVRRYLWIGVLLVTQVGCHPVVNQLGDSVVNTLQDALHSLVEDISTNIQNQVDLFFDETQSKISDWYKNAIEGIKEAVPFIGEKDDEIISDSDEYSRSETEGAGDDPDKVEYSVFGEINDRVALLDRALVWIRQPIPYSRSNKPSDMYEGKFRQDCSGFVSYAWGIEPGPNGGLNTTGLRSDAVTHPVEVIDLRPGDILVTVEGANKAHVLIFAGWKDKEKLTFIAYEQVDAQVEKPRLLQIVEVNGSFYIPGESESEKVGDPGTGPYVARRSNQFR